MRSQSEPRSATESSARSSRRVASPLSANGGPTAAPAFMPTTTWRHSDFGLTPATALTLQRSLGNRAVVQMLQASEVQREDGSSQVEPGGGPTGGGLSGTLQREIEQSRGHGRALDAETGAKMGNAFGKDFGGVKIHTDAKADSISRAINAKAFTVGQDIYFRKSQYAPHSSGGQRLLAHELTHVVQQTSGSDPTGAGATGSSATIQPKLTVGASNDRFEAEADRVAQQVTSRMPTQPSVQRKGNHRYADEDVQCTAVTTGTPPIHVHHKTNHAMVARSYQARAVQFEQALGRYAFHHPKANAAAKAMADHIQKYIARKAKEEGATEKKIDQLWLKAGGSHKEIAGSVGEKIEDIKKVFAKGNLRERMTHIYNFVEHQFQHVTNKDIGPIEEISRGGDRVAKQFYAFFDRTGQSDDIYYGDVMHKSAPKAGPLQEQGRIRQRTGEDSSTQLTVKDVGFDKEGGLLSKREARMMFGDFDSKESLQGKKLTWSEGARAWKIDKNHAWSQLMQTLDMPLMAGPSAHTNAFMNIATLFGVKDLASVRLAAIGHLLPINAHSLVEIMAAAAGHGLSFSPGPEMYRSIAPLKSGELRNQVGKGAFPDEFGSPETGHGGDYRKLTDTFREVMKLFAVPPDQADPKRQVTKLTDLDKLAVKHIANKQKEKAKLKVGKQDEILRLDARINAVDEMREHIKVKLKIANHSLKLALSRKRIQELSGSKQFDDKLFHGTHTGLLAGLTKSEGTLISAKELENRGIVRSTGEGDFFSNGVQRGPKDFISVGLGEFGLGTALAYAQAAGTLPNYNIERYKDEELALEVQRLQEAIANYDESLIDLDKSEREYKSKAQLQNLLDRLQAEINLRNTLPQDHPRRRGELSEESNFPLLFEFVERGLDVRDDGGYKSREQLSLQERTYNTEMLGERMVYGGTIDMKPRIRRVYCPVDKMDLVTEKLKTIFGHSDFEVLAIEALIEMPTSTPIGGVRHETYAMQMDFEDVRKNVISGYAQAMKTKQKFNDPRKMAREYGSLPPSKNLKDDSRDVPKEVVDKKKQEETKTVESVKQVTQSVDSPRPTTDVPVQQQTPLEQSLGTDGLRVHKIDGDGDCLFASVLHQLGQQGTVYRSPMALRRALAQHMLQLSTDFKRTVLAPVFSVENLSIEQAALRIQTPGYWSGLVGDTAPQLLASLLERTLILYRPDGSKQNVTPLGEDKHAALRLVYNGTSHYDSTAASGVSGPQVSTIKDEGSSVVPDEIKSPSKSLDESETTAPDLNESGIPKTKSPDTTVVPSDVATSTVDKGAPKSTDTSPQSTVNPPQPIQNLLKDDSPPMPAPKKGKPRIVLSGHGLLKENTTPTKTKVPSGMTISFTGPMGSILDNPLANAVEEERLLPEDIFVEAADLETGDVTEIEPHEIMKLYKIFGPRTIKGGKMTPNYTLTPPKNLTVSVGPQVYTVDRNHTLAEIFPILRKIYPKGVNVQWAACQDLPDVDRRFQIKVMSVKDRFVSNGVVQRPTTSGAGRKQTIKLISKMVKDFKSI